MPVDSDANLDRFRSRTNYFQDITTESSRRIQIDVSFKPEPLEVNDSLMKFKNWMKAFRRFYSSNLISKLPLDEQRGYLDNCLYSSGRSNLEQFLDMGDVQSIDAYLDALNGHYSVLNRRVDFNKCLCQPSWQNQVFEVSICQEKGLKLDFTEFAGAYQSIKRRVESVGEADGEYYK
ncbi:unnamed protein product [Lepeophtheirus salmonis]|uniref:(salmon louse) hypothetical protein n=1 Tax=Lepeophtheirus salmonis TaxID=72036 RepID=A0A7R8CXA3_LEPSM|nr:unnamed protein product [Lepeophtheirus salmonis]CAF2929480.1 unnamed protein product [Lepeophtheirus salmonis]